MPGAHLYGWVGDPINDWVKCKVTSEGKLIIDPTGFLENPPTEDEANKAPTSEWAFDHDADEAAHHAKYTDADSRGAINNVIGAGGTFQSNMVMNYYRLIGLEYIKMGQSALSTHEVTIKSILNSARIDIYTVILPATLTPSIIRLHDGSAYKEVIHQGTFQTNLALFLEETPTNDVVNKAPTSNWAFDHDANAAAHHAKYTDAEAVGSFGSRSATLTNGTYDSYDLTNLNLIYLDDTGGAIDLRGFAGGSDGKIVFFIREVADNDITVRNSHATPTAVNRILTAPTADQTLTMAEYGGFILIYKASRWRMINALP